MSIEDVRKLELGVDKMCNCEKYVTNKDELTNERIQQLINAGLALEEEAMQSGDIDVLERAIDYFLEEEEDIALSNGGCERLETDIWDNFSEKQIIMVFEKKFGDLLRKNMFRACTTSIAIINTGYFDDLRRIFNKVKSNKSSNFVEELFSWGSKKKFRDEALVLKEDMESWG